MSGDTWLTLATRDMDTMEPPTVEFAEAVVGSMVEFEQDDPLSSLSWPLHVYSLSMYAQHAEASGIVGFGPFGPFGRPLPRLIWSLVLAAGAALVSTADLGWSP